MYKKILIPLDRSFGAEATLAVAADLGRANGSVICLLPGSVAEAVLRRSEVAVHLVRHGLPAAA